MSKKKRKSNGGFTKVELLAILSILSLVISITVTTSIEVINKSKIKGYLTTKNNVTLAAGNFVTDSTDLPEWIDGNNCRGEKPCQYQCVTVGSLLNQGYYSESALGSEIAKGKKLNKNHSVYIERNTNNQTITHRELNASECSNPNGNIEFSISPSGWSKEKEITITYILDGNYELDGLGYSYSSNGNNNLYQNFNSRKITKTIRVTDNKTLTAKIGSDREEAIVISKIDNDNPTGTINLNNQVSDNKKANIILNDTKSGVQSYYFGKTNPTTKKVSYKNIENNKQINVSEEINSSGTYYLSVKDAVGNSSQTSSINIRETKLNISNAKTSVNRILEQENTKYNLSNIKVTPDAYYTFNGWYDTNGNKVTDYTIPTKDTVLKGKVTENKFENAKVTISKRTDGSYEAKISGLTLTNHSNTDGVTYTYDWYSKDGELLYTQENITSATSVYKVNKDNVLATPNVPNNGGNNNSNDKPNNNGSVATPNIGGNNSVATPNIGGNNSVATPNIGGNSSVATPGESGLRRTANANINSLNDEYTVIVTASKPNYKSLSIDTRTLNGITIGDKEQPLSLSSDYLKLEYGQKFPNPLFTVTKKGINTTISVECSDCNLPFEKEKLKGQNWNISTSTYAKLSPGKYHINVTTRETFWYDSASKTFTLEIVPDNYINFTTKAVEFEYGNVPSTYDVKYNYKKDNSYIDVIVSNDYIKYEKYYGTLTLKNLDKLAPGEYTVKLNYETGYQCNDVFTITINLPKNDKLEVKANKNLKYNGNSQKLVTTTGATGKVYYSVNYPIDKSNYLKQGQTNIPSEVGSGLYKVYYYEEPEVGYMPNLGVVDVKIQGYDGFINLNKNYDSIPNGVKTLSLEIHDHHGGEIYAIPNNDKITYEIKDNNEIILKNLDQLSDGKYEIMVVSNRTEKYEPANSIFTLTVDSKLPPTVLKKLSPVYTGKKLQLVSIDEGYFYYGEVYCKVGNGQEYNYKQSIPTAVEVGTYRVYCRQEGKNGYGNLKMEVDVYIRQANGYITLSSTNDKITYGETSTKKIQILDYHDRNKGQKLTVTSSNELIGIELTEDYMNLSNLDKLDSGTYTITLSNAETNNYKATTTTYTLIVNKAQNPTTVNGNTILATGKNVDLVKTRTIDGISVYYSINFKLDSTNFMKGSTNIPKENKCNKYTVYWYAMGSNYETTQGSVSAEIACDSGYIKLDKYSIDRTEGVGANTIIWIKDYHGGSLSVSASNSTIQATIKDNIYNNGYKDKYIELSNLTALSAGTYNITIKSEKTDRYESTAVTYQVIVRKPYTLYGKWKWNDDVYTLSDDTRGKYIEMPFKSLNDKGYTSFSGIDIYSVDNDGVIIEYVYTATNGRTYNSNFASGRLSYGDTYIWKAGIRKYPLHFDSSQPEEAKYMDFGFDGITFKSKEKCEGILWWKKCVTDNSDIFFYNWFTANATKVE